MPILSPVISSLVSAGILIGYGIIWEKHYVAWASVVMNLIYSLLLLSSINVPILFAEILAIYLLLGFVFSAIGVSEAYILFGTKTYGSLALVLSIYQDIDPTGAVFNQAIQSTEIIIAWLLLAILVHIAGYKYKEWRADEDD